MSLLTVKDLQVYFPVRGGFFLIENWTKFRQFAM